MNLSTWVDQNLIPALTALETLAQCEGEETPPPPPPPQTSALRYLVGPEESLEASLPSGLAVGDLVAVDAYSAASARYRAYWECRSASAVLPDGAVAGDVAGAARGALYLENPDGGYFQFALTGECNVAAYGWADGADNTAALQAAIYGAAGRKVVIPPGVSKNTSPLILISNTHLDFQPGAVIDISEEIPGGGYVETVFHAVGAVTGAVPLAANASLGALSVSVAAGDEAGFAAGDMVRIRSEKQLVADACKLGEYQAVRSVASGVIAFKDGLWDPYATADSAAIEKLESVRNIKITGGKFLGAGTAASQSVAIFEFCEDVWVEGCISEEFVRYGWNPRSSIRVTFKGVRAVRHSNIGLAYGIILQEGCQWVDILGCHFEDCRHGVASGGSAAKYGVTRFVNVAGCTAYGCTSTAFDSKASNQFWVIDGNTVTCREGLTGSADGILTQGSNFIISNNMIVGSQRHGIFLQPRSARHDATYTVIGNTVLRAGEIGINVAPQEVGDQTIDGVVVSGNTVRDSVGIGIQVSCNLTGAAMRNVSVTGNNVKLASTTVRGIWIRAQSGPLTDGVVANNIVELGAGSTREGIELRADAGQTLSGIVVSGNRVKGAAIGINATAGAGATRQDCYVSGNITKGCGTATAGFGAGELGANLA